MSYVLENEGHGEVLVCLRHDSRPNIADNALSGNASDFAVEATSSTILTEDRSHPDGSEAEQR